MTIDAASLLAALQFGDGQFPGGGFAFSWGIETLAATGHLHRQDWPSYLIAQMTHRWAVLDRPLIAHAHAAAGDQTALRDLDDWAEALTLPEAARTGSRRAGAALLGTHARLGTPGAAAYRLRVQAGEVEGHLAIVQGLVLVGSDLDCQTSLAIAGYTTAQALGTAALRLGVISAMDAQQALVGLRQVLPALIAAAIPPVAEIGGFAPLSDLAMMLHPRQAQQLFAN